jgi:ubiquinone/menaquinone biosynthesis C-methylase UbiE
MTLHPAPRYSETDRIREVYQRYDTSRRWQRKRDLSNPGFTQLQQERWTAIHAILAERLRYPGSPRVLDIGCGTGADLVRIAGLLPDAELHGVDLSQARIEAARQAVPGADLRVQGAEALSFADRSFQVVVLSTVLSSILDADTRRRVAAEALRVTSEDGVLLVYDMRLPSPANRNVRAIGKRELRALLPGSRIRAQAITVLPPIARTVCRVWPRMYRHLARISPLRSHYLSVVTGEPRISSEPFPSGDENEPSHNQASTRAS